MEEIATVILIASGIATRYNPGVMDAVVANRIMWGQVDPAVEVEGYVALLDCKWVGHTVALETPDGEVIWPVMVSDCAAAQDRDRLEQTGFAVDLSWELAERLGVINNIGKGFKVWTMPPEPERTDTDEGDYRYGLRLAINAHRQRHRPIK